ncbi:hypothetical protein HYPSUDRAFT_209003 [Hypholoma sublateritium FD-334 SS-4]|uniref:Uncharacterized protein n=1 Tax=Hypholoma sublateritium (strain FD-334 SS-4) TaxID=945553 RepID=A0A0D2P083_HYPSF|nr:hypothetical protein HYPSUDRAFT_209003 [Hypholoma sublateritium FD-334 SS-4]
MADISMAYPSTGSGRVQILDGRVYYSPNSDRTICSTPPVDDPMRSIFHPKIASTLPDGRFNAWDLNAAEYLQPRWWSRPWGWISFFPIEPHFEDPPFTCLLAAPRRANHIYREFNGYVMPNNISLEWLQLDRNLTKATALLQTYYQIAAVRPISPWGFGYPRWHKDRRHLLVSINKGREWFGVWMALFSFVIARAETVEREFASYPHLAKDNWKTLLTKNGFDRTWIDSILRSVVWSFSQETVRAGVFLHLPPRDELQPEVEWFCSYHVPVWYPWEKEQASNRKWAHLAPPVHVLQMGTTNITINPSPIPIAVNHDTASLPLPINSPTNVPSSDIHVPPALVDRPSSHWTSFFASQAERNRRQLSRESVQDRERREARERQPPVKSAKVFHWIKTSAGHFVREAVSKKWREDTLADYSAKQKRYNSFDNEWDCFTDFGSDDECDSDDVDDADIGFFINDEEVSEANAPYDPSPPLPPNRDPHEYNSDWLQTSTVITAFEEEIIDIAQKFFGFVCPLPAPSGPPVAPNNQKNVLKLLGLSWDKSVDVFKQPRALLAFDFVRRLCAKWSISDEWDLSRGNRAYIAFSSRFSTIRRLESKIGPVFMFDLAKHSSQQWKLATTAARHALTICRLDPGMREDEIARFLVNRGIPFRTLQKSDALGRGPRFPPPKVVHPTRAVDYVFTFEDYHAYTQHCATLLRHPRSRAALMKGGYLWRVSVPILSVQKVIDGPSGWSTDPNEMFVASSTELGEFVDDELTDSEVEAFCGVYRCSTGYGPQTSSKSWCPLPGIFDNSGLDYGHWTSINEDLYAIAYPSNGTIKRQPCTASKWRNITRGLGDVRRGIAHIEEQSRSIIAM